MRLLTASVLTIALAAIAMSAEAQVLFHEDWESPTWNVGDVMITQNGWSRATGNFSRPEIIASATGLTGQVADASNPSGTIGTFSSFTNTAGLDNIPAIPPDGELNLSWRWLLNPSGGEGVTGSANVGFLSGVNLSLSILNNGTQARFTDMDDNDTPVDLPLGGGAEQVVDFELFATNNGGGSHGWRMNGVTMATIAGAPTFNNIGSMRWGCGRDAGFNCGIMGDITVTVTPEPASLGLLALGGLAVLSRRR